MMKVLFLTNVPSPYRVDFFNELGKFCKLTVLFQKKTSDERDSSWRNYSFNNFEGIFLKGISLNADTAFCPRVTKYIKKKIFDKIVICDYSSPTGMLAILKLRLKKIEYYIEIDGGFAKSGKGIKERVKSFFLSKASGYFSTGDEADNYLIHYGAKKELIHRYPFTSLKQKDISDNLCTIKNKNFVKKQMLCDNSFVILSIGQFIPRKGFDLLLKAISDLNGIHLFLIGGKPTDEYLNIVEEGRLSNITFLPYMNKEDLDKYFTCSDIFVLPTREDIWGLVVNEAISYGLPVITTNRCLAGLELIHDDDVGKIVPKEDIESLRKSIIDYTNENIYLSEKVEKRIKLISNYSIEKMVSAHLNVFIDKDNQMV